MNLANDVMTTQEVMNYLKISRSTLYRLVEQGRIIPIKLGHRTVRYKRADVVKLMETSATVSKSTPEADGGAK